MDMTSIAAAQASIKALMGLAKGATSAVVDHQLKDRLIGIQSGILEVQAKLADAQAERVELIGLNAELREKVRVFEAAKAALNDYRLFEIDGGKYLYKYKPEGPDHVNHFACPSCYNDAKVSVLQAPKTGTKQVTYVCKACKFKMTVGPSDPMKQPRSRPVGSWMSM